MLIERIWSGNAYRNFHYLIACPETGEALAVDPLEWQLCLNVAQQKGWTITQILNTHEHLDHTGGNQGLVGATGAKVLAHAGAASRIGGVDRGPEEGRRDPGGGVRSSWSVSTLRGTPWRISACWDMVISQRCFAVTRSSTRAPGTVHGGGNPESLYDTFVTQLARLPENTRVFPGHEYLARNLQFTLDREPDNVAARALLGQAQAEEPAAATITTLAREKEINTFFRLQSPGVIAGLRAAFPDLEEHPDARTVFVKLRQLRNSW